jgi:hypothetical protein
MQKHFFIAFFLITQALHIKAQDADTTIAFPFLQIGYAYQNPAGDLYARFGPNSSLNTGLFYKLKNQYYFGIEGSFFFGKKVKETGMLDSIKTSTGFIITPSGELADIRFYERGFTTDLRFGKIWTSGKKTYSGFFNEVGVGFIQHKIRIEQVGNSSPQLTGEYKKGYDRLTNGLMLSLFTGYRYFSKNKYFNAFGGVEFNLGLTENRRSINFDTMQHDATKRKDVLAGLKVGIIIPFYKRDPEAYFYK